MNQSNAVKYPGETATPAQVFRLAEEYRKASEILVQQGRRGEPLSRAPCRLSAIHAIELYLNAMLLHAGQQTSSIRGMKHDLAARVKLALKGGLQLRKRTAAHLATLAENREYLVIRYDAEMNSTVSQINRLIATLNEIALKVNKIIDQPNAGAQNN